ncbi:MAG TPA: PepSY domain-containing protein [Rhodocyclaceae bacterium]|nr:PepSY domain-containing protein [Rhodocyclaceae bacterium]
MRPLLLPLIAIFALVASSAAPLPVYGKDKERKTEERRAKKAAQEAAFAALQRGEILPVTRIMQIATSRVPGDIIEIEYKAGPVYEVEILTPDGRVKEIKLDARSGEVIRIKDD